MRVLFAVGASLMLISLVLQGMVFAITETNREDCESHGGVIASAKTGYDICFVNGHVVRMDGHPKW